MQIKDAYKLIDKDNGFGLEKPAITQAVELQKILDDNRQTGEKFYTIDELEKIIKSGELNN